MTHTVAVYGSLRKGLSNHRWLKGSKFVGYARTEAEFQLLDLGPFPGAVRCSSNMSRRQSIVVEVYEVSDETFAALDQLEGHPTFYEREEIPCPLPKTTATMWIYLLKRTERYKIVPSADWFEYHSARRREEQARRQEEHARRQETKNNPKDF